MLFLVGLDVRVKYLRSVTRSLILLFSPPKVTMGREKWFVLKSALFVISSNISKV